MRPKPLAPTARAPNVYGGDFFNPARRSEWDPTEQPFDPERAVSRFEDANRLFAKGRDRTSER